MDERKQLGAMEEEGNGMVLDIREHLSAETLAAVTAVIPKSLLNSAGIRGMESSACVSMQSESPEM